MPEIIAPADATTDEFHGQTVADPYRLLEQLDAPATKAWVAAENAHTEAFLKPFAPQIAAARQALQAQLRYDKAGLPHHRGKYWTRHFHKQLANQGLTQIADNPTGPWETLLDPLVIDPTGNTSIYSMNFSEDGTRLAYALSKGGDDEVTLYVMDVATRQLLPDVIEHARFIGVTWNADNQGFHYTYPAGTDDKRMVLKYHRLGQDMPSDSLIYEDRHADSFVDLKRYRVSRLELLSTVIGTNTKSIHQWRMEGEAAFKPLIMEPEEISIVDLIDGRIFAVTRKGAERGQLVSFAPETSNERTVLVPEHSQHLLNSAFYRAGKLFLTYTVDTADKIAIHDLQGKVLGELPIPQQSTISFGGDNPDDFGIYIQLSSFLTPGTQYWYDYANNRLTHFADSPVPETLEDCIVERIHAKSKDGTLVPMSVIRAPTTKLDGTAPLKLYGYGGFNVPLGPGFTGSLLVWIRAGGIYAQANLRGGGEYGTGWYDGGRLLNKQNVFDDFVACAEHLIAENYTSSKRLVIEGGSNGGLLTLACMLQRPELFGAVISHVPVTDLLRFDLHTFGAAWKSDYGDPKQDKADFDTAMAYSPLHNVKDGQLYPPHLVLTAEKDTRVVPSHAYKFIATMQAKADPQTKSLLRVDTDAGHGAGVALDKTIMAKAETMAFCQATIGGLNLGDR